LDDPRPTRSPGALGNKKLQGYQLMSLANLNRFQSGLDRVSGVVLTGLGVLLTASMLFIGA